MKMLRYQTIHASERIDVNKTSASKECELFCDCFFKDIGFKFEEHVCNKCHDLLSAKGATFRCILMGISKNETLKQLNNSVTYDRGVL